MKNESWSKRKKTRRKFMSVSKARNKFLFENLSVTVDLSALTFSNHREGRAGISKVRFVWRVTASHRWDFGSMRASAMLPAYGHGPMYVFASAKLISLKMMINLSNRWPCDIFEWIYKPLENFVRDEIRVVRQVQKRADKLQCGHCLQIAKVWKSI